ncbi:type II toxin-antitoxin system Phd/YefM family antitoxin [Desulfotomaculum copahuensis]|uniref:Antitoxin n=1 Tax=Desulfotomaculum copahuensis TaxID=1838280 RepID=A0A1B7LGJ0_9FIRM|nr:type II toxin-antitoxin system prevent-host-death family antitoxin [Desulfotomaculum copahuensis]OAT85216.1 hypothetical protein A6M21_06630 [Desulfotomaculum copahuensis]
MADVGIREIKNSLSHYLGRVKKGETFIITDRGVPVARLLPIQVDVPEGINAMLQAGQVSWGGSKPRGSVCRPRLQGGKTLAAVVAEDRR